MSRHVAYIYLKLQCHFSLHTWVHFCCMSLIASSSTPSSSSPSSSSPQTCPDIDDVHVASSSSDDPFKHSQNPTGVYQTQNDLFTYYFLALVCIFIFYHMRVPHIRVNVTPQTSVLVRYPPLNLSDPERRLLACLAHSMFSTPHCSAPATYTSYYS
jgi:hypothetical protein